MTEGSDGKTIDGMSLTRIADLIDLLRKETYQPKPARRVYIPKKNAKMRLLGGAIFWRQIGIESNTDDSRNHLWRAVSRLLTWFQIQCFLRLIGKFLKAGYLEDWTFHNTFSGTPQGGIVSPILVNIYLDRLDEFMMGIHPEIWCGSHSDSQTFRGAQKSWFSEESGYAKTWNGNG